MPRIPNTGDGILFRFSSGSPWIARAIVINGRRAPIAWGRQSRLRAWVRDGFGEDMVLCWKQQCLPMSSSPNCSITEASSENILITSKVKKNNATQDLETSPGLRTVQSMFSSGRRTAVVHTSPEKPTTRQTMKRLKPCNADYVWRVALVSGADSRSRVVLDATCTDVGGKHGMRMGRLC